MEKEITGLYLSGHPMDDYQDIARQRGAVPIGQVLEDAALPDGPQQVQDGQRLTLAGVVASVKTKTTRNRSLMAYVVLEDATGNLEMTVFSRLLEECGSYLQVNMPLLAQGKLILREDKAPQFLCDQLTPLVQVPGQPAGQHKVLPGRLYLRFSGQADPRLERVKDLFCLFPGQQGAVLYLAAEGRRLGGHCQIHTAMVQELRELLGEENVVVQ